MSEHSTRLLIHGAQGRMGQALLRLCGEQSGCGVVAAVSRRNPSQRVVDGVLTQLGELAQQVESPALIVVGRVVELRDRLNWFSNH